MAIISEQFGLARVKAGVQRREREKREVRKLGGGDLLSRKNGMSIGSFSLKHCKSQRRKEITERPREQGDPHSRVEKLAKIRQIAGKKRQLRRRLTGRDIFPSLSGSKLRNC